MAARQPPFACPAHPSQPPRQLLKKVAVAFQICVAVCIADSAFSTFNSPLPGSGRTTGATNAQTHTRKAESPDARWPCPPPYAPHPAPARRHPAKTRPGLPQRQIGKQQMVIHHQQISVMHPGARPLQKAALALRTLAPGSCHAPRKPHSGILRRLAAHLLHTAILRCVRPNTNTLQIRRHPVAK